MGLTCARSSRRDRDSRRSAQGTYRCGNMRRQLISRDYSKPLEMVGLCGREGDLRAMEGLAGEVGLLDQVDVCRQESTCLEWSTTGEKSLGTHEDPGAPTHLCLSAH